jgi:microsomal dipeptidase-like Zn-dependent dipeptidase
MQRSATFAPSRVRNLLTLAVLATLTLGRTAQGEGGVIAPPGPDPLTAAYSGRYRPPRLGTLRMPPPPTGITPDDGPPVWHVGEPDDPFDDTPPELPGPKCTDGTGWSFEKGLEGWRVKGTAFGRGPVYGNNVHIDRLRPPGYSSSPEASPAEHVGGDYWAFSRDVNQQGNWWMGSSDIRSGPHDPPGTRNADSATGTVTSPEFVIGAPYIEFYIGGTSDKNQRVQLEVEYKGVKDLLGLVVAYDGIGRAEPLFGASLVPPASLDSGFAVVRASSALENGEFMRRRVVWDVSKFVDRKAHIVIVDGNTVATSFGAHVNVDEIVCENEVGDDVQWLSPRVGSTFTSIPLWGTTDTHTHPLVNLAFGGRLMWGDISDSLADVYDCTRTLPAITYDGEVVRPTISPETQEASCNASDAMKFKLLSLCAPADILCIAQMNGLIGDLSQPILYVSQYHGGASPLMGGITLGGAILDVPQLINFISSFQADLDLSGHVNGLVERLGWDMDDGTHSRHNIRTHQFFQADMVRRAWQGGLRLVGIDVIDARVLTQMLAPGKVYNEWRTIRDSVNDVLRLVSCDPAATGPLCDIAGIALSPAGARELIAANKMAIVLGTETDELGVPRNPETMVLFGHGAATDTPELQVADLYDLGIRKVTAIHALDNRLGGAGIFNDTYAGGNNETQNLLSPSLTSKDSLSVPYLDVAIKRHTDASSHAGWVALDDQIGNWISDGSDITFHYGFDGAATPLAYAGTWGPDGQSVENGFLHRGNWSGLDEIIYATGANDLIDGAPICSLDYIPIPQPTKVTVPDVLPQVVWDESFNQVQANALGLTDDGRAFVTAMMKHGMVIDLDHFSQNARADAWDVAEQFGQDANVNGQLFGDVPEYPFFGVHTDVRPITRHSPAPDLPWIRAERGFTTEVDRTPVEFERSRLAGGTFSPGANASHLMDGPELDPLVRNDCDYSSKSFALKYMWIMHHMDGHGVTPSSDMSPFFTAAAPRFGQNQCHLKKKAHDQVYFDSSDVDDHFKDPTPKPCPPDLIGGPTNECALQNFPHDWDPGLPAICATQGRLQPSCPTYKNLQHQYAEGAGVEYEDYGARNPVALDPNVPNVKMVVARGASENRDDGAPREGVNERVTYGGAHQLKPMKKFITSDGNVAENTGWDINLDGYQHVGLLPDFLQDVRNVGVPFEYMTPLFNAAEEYVRMWERQCQLASEHAAGSFDCQN